MTSKEFVKSIYPTARAERQKRRGPFGKVYWLIRERGEVHYIAEGKTESNAWVNAKKKIKEREQ